MGVALLWGAALLGAVALVFVDGLRDAYKNGPEHGIQRALTDTAVVAAIVLIAWLAAGRR